MDIQIIIPVYKPNNKFAEVLEQIKKQIIKNIPVLIIDSGSDKKYFYEIKNMNCQVKRIDVKTFNHGRTRQMGIDIFPNKDIYIFLTQDAILADEYAISNIIKVFKNKKVGCAYGRQLPHKEASYFARYARLFNYGTKNYIRTLKDSSKYGIKTVFLSNSFAAYRNIALRDVGGFPNNVILSEDMYVATKMLLKNWYIAYCADAKVYHSHDYTVIQEFKRYFDIGVFHCRENWIRKNFGEAEGEGKKFILGEIQYLLKKNLFLLPEMIVRDGAKFLGYRLGLNEKFLPNAIKKKMSMNSNFWKN